MAAGSSSSSHIKGMSQDSRPIWFCDLLGEAKAALDQSVVSLRAASAYGNSGMPIWANFGIAWHANLQRQQAVRETLFKMYDALNEGQISDSGFLHTNFEHALVSSLPRSCLRDYKSIHEAICHYKNLDSQLAEAFDLLKMAQDYQTAKNDEGRQRRLEWDLLTGVRSCEFNARPNWYKDLVKNAAINIRLASELFNEALADGSEAFIAQTPAVEGLTAWNAMMKEQQGVMLELGWNVLDAQQGRKAKFCNAGFQVGALRLLVSCLALRPGQKAISEECFQSCVRALSKYELFSSKLATTTRWLKTAQDYYHGDRS